MLEYYKFHGVVFKCFVFFLWFVGFCIFGTMSNTFIENVGYSIFDILIFFFLLYFHKSVFISKETFEDFQEIRKRSYMNDDNDSDLVIKIRR
ncbi:hypothetical protein OAS_20485 [Vibrio cyclitrophicus ZF65]|nr:hypothetical protein OAS_20485 [Vibrio cyclitrophicus ZF65]